MRIAEPDSSLPLGGRTYVSRFGNLADVLRLATLLASIALLAQPIHTNAKTRSAQAPGAVQEHSGVGPPRPGLPRYDCITGDIGKANGSRERLKEAINEALDILKECSACHQFYGGDGAVKRLTEMRDKDKIVLTVNYPELFEPVGSAYYPKDSPEFDKGDLAVAKDMEPTKPRKTYLQPCIFVNSDSWMTHDDMPMYYPYKGLPLRRARGIAILHEFGHTVGVIPSDAPLEGEEDGMKSAWRSSENTLCVKKVCESCADSYAPCVHKPVAGWFVKAYKEFMKPPPVKQSVLRPPAKKSAQRPTAKRRRR